MAGEPLDVLRIYQNQFLEMFFQNVPDRAPILPGGFHGDFGHFAALQPSAQLLQITGERAKGSPADFRLRLAYRWQDANRHVLFMDVHAATAAILLRFHLSVPLRSPSEGRLKHGLMTFLHVFIRAGGRQQLLVPVSAS